jgi:hypothetical protein
MPIETRCYPSPPSFGAARCTHKKTRAAAGK